jgi:hypothetical protein
LLSITENEISLCNKRTKNNVVEIEKDSIKKVLIHGKSNVLSGLGYGALIGVVPGTIIGYAVGGVKGPTPAIVFGSKEEVTYSSSGQNALIGGSIGVLFGGLIGVIVGITSSTPDRTIEINSDDDYYKLMRYTNYPSYESQIHEDYK